MKTDSAGHTRFAHATDSPLATLEALQEALRRACAGTPSAAALAPGDLDLTIISDGVETQAQPDYLRRAGTQLLQGYFSDAPCRRPPSPTC